MLMLIFDYKVPLVNSHGAKFEYLWIKTSYDHGFKKCYIT